MDQITLCRSKQISYLRARDPSILTGNVGFALDNVKVNLAQADLQEVSSVLNEPSKNFIEINLRIKKTEYLKELYEFNKDTIICNVPEGSHCLRNVKEGDAVIRKYKFTNIFGPDSTQVELFNSVVKPKIFQFINGRSSSLLTYGASGSGKTYTIVGTATEPGVIPRALEYLFRTLPKIPTETAFKPDFTGNAIFLNEAGRKKEADVRHHLLNVTTSTIDKQHIRTYKAMQQRLSTEPVATVDASSELVLGVWISYAEIYNEYIYDLLKPEPLRGKVREKLTLSTSNGHTFIRDLTSINIFSGLEAYEILQYGLHNLKYAATCINSHSSRSHSIFTIKLVQGSVKKQDFTVSYFNFCDLAGSERVKKTMNVGERLKESNNINTSLLVLGRCISSIRQSQKNNDNRLIPFRESKLTQLFQRALSGFEDITMIVNINPIKDMFDESQHVLNFSAIAKDIIVNPQARIAKHRGNRFSAYMESGNRRTDKEPPKEEINELRELVDKLYVDLEEQRFQSEQMMLENEAQTRAELIRDYSRLIEKINNNHSERAARLEQFYKEQNEAELDALREKYEDLLRDSKHAEVINLDSSDDEESKPGEQFMELNRKVNALQADVTRLSFENEEKQEQIMKLNQNNIELIQENSRLKTRNLELEGILQDAEELVAVYKEEVSKLASENLVLREDVSEQIEEHENAQIIPKDFNIFF